VKTYAAGAWLFHESSPRLWIGFVVQGVVEIVRGLHGNQVQLASLGRGALIGKGAPARRLRSLHRRFSPRVLWCTRFQARAGGGAPEQA